jgi:CheY-like chemotaxis protein
MKLILIKPVGSNLSITSDKVEIETILFDIEKYKGKLDEFVASLANLEFEGIIVSDTLDESINYLGLELCIRVRLSPEVLADRIYSSVFIYNSKDPQEIYKSQVLHKSNTTASIFFTQGTFSFDDQDTAKFLIENFSNFNLLNANNFQDQFLDVIQIKKNPEFGNHAIANLWGAIRLAEVTGNKNLLEKHFESNSKLRENHSDLYLKLLINQSSFSDVKTANKASIKASGKNILLIDDEENKGWAVLLAELFQGSNFESVKKSSNFLDDIKAKIKEKTQDINKWDLILLDLRLLENEDKGDESLKVGSEYSGAKILREIKSENKGIQVIMFTASNKAWNMKELQEIGADGFYIKESPEYSKDLKFSVGNFNNFEKQATICFENVFLKEIHFRNENIIRKLNSISSVGGGVGLMALSKQKLKNEIVLQINQSYELLRSAYINEFNYTMSFLSYFKIIELLNDYFLEFDNLNSKFIHKNSGKTLDECRFDPTNGKYVFNLQSRWDLYKTSTPLKFYNVLQNELGFKITSADKNLAQRVYDYNNLRKDIIHPKDLSVYRKATKTDNIKIINDLESCILRLT